MEGAHRNATIPSENIWGVYLPAVMLNSFAVRRDLIGDYLLLDQR